MTNPNYSADDFSSSDADISSTEMRSSAAETSSDLEPTASDSTSYSTQPSGKAKGSFAASTWIALIVGFLLLIVLIVFMMQNQHEVPMNFLGWSGEFPAGIAFLIFAIGGALIMALVGGWRMFELRRQLRKQAQQV
ncbi:LapA family protein [Corynebacterium yonathiae]|uniref:Lipopolysaccharide assembly protein LapA domain-containing protein n=1 Tax=Corynebacterium yonathiae TaxID=2913504 RepID=A0A9X3RLF0_9CORY|nr:MULTISPECIES: lipopolysaccharide assembly protein LapA domain-containing protein [Corynebacterium]MCZ9295191.1 lipopolysaccharide assembly protein LapA domain-containing protein [Corynebacterium yonathiae]MDK2582096.1 lipopolysaccharide assembly protein LapA domain-containing protein [Corynebacterium sp. BWA136]